MFKKLRAINRRRRMGWTKGDEKTFKAGAEESVNDLNRAVKRDESGENRGSNKVRNWFERNQIFFTIATSVLLSVMAITVSIQSNELVDYQNKLISLEYVPEFNVVPSVVSFENDILTAREINIFNNGGYYYDNLRYSTRLVIGIHKNGQVTKIPIEYYFYSMPYDEKVGQVLKIKGSADAGKKLSELYKLVQESNNDVSMGLDSYLRLEYKDTLNGTEEVRYFDVSTYLEGNFLMEKKEGESIFDDSKEKPLDIYWDFEAIKNLINEKIQNNS